MATSSDELIGKQLGTYRILEEIGKGGMAVVFKAEETAKGEVVALKVLSSDFTADVRALERFKREALTTKSLEHPNIIKIYALGDQDGLHYFAMEYLPHQSLHDMIKERGKLPIPRAVEIVKQTLAGLGAAHKAGVIHRDLKPENIMIDKDGKPILVDFGIAKVGKGARLTQTGVLLGTPYYMSPEQITGKEVAVQSDLYSMGVVLYELLTANVPFQADSTFMITYKHCTEAPPPPRKFNDQIPEALQLVVLKSLEKDLRKRYQSAEEFARDLEAFEAGKNLDIEVTKVRDIYSLPEFKAGMGHLNQKEFEAARSAFAQVVKDVPDPEFAAEAQRRIGETWFQEKDYVRAFREYKAVADKWPQTEEARRIPLLYDGCWYEHLMQGEVKLSELGRSAAISHMASMLAALDEERVPDSERSDNHWVRRLEDRTRELTEQLRRLRLLQWTAVAGALGAVAGLVLLGLYFRFVDPFAGHLVAARYEGLRGRPEAVVREYMAALALKPGNVPTLVRLGEALIWVGKPADARTTLAAALETEPRHARAHELMGDLDQAAGEGSSAASHFRAAAEAEPQSSGLWLKLGVAAGSIGDVEAEFAALGRALKLRPDFPEAFNALGMAYWKRKREVEKALAAFDEAIRLDPEYAAAHHNRGKLLMSLDQLEAAEKSLLEAIRFEPDRVDSHYHLAVLYTDSRRPQREKALHELRSALTHARARGEPAANIRYLLGQLVEGLAGERSGEEAAKLREEAAAHYQEALRERPREPNYARRLGNFWLGQRSYGHAAEAFLTWREAEPANPEPAYQAGRALLASARTTEAVGMFADAVRLEPGNPDFRHQLGKALEALPDPAGAERAYQEALALRPDHRPSLIALVEAASARRDAGAARIWAERILALPPATGERPALVEQALVAAARALAGAGELARAAGVLEPVVATAGPHPVARGELGRILLAQGRSEGCAMIARSLEEDPYQDGAAALRELAGRSCRTR